MPGGGDGSCWYRPQQRQTLTLPPLLQVQVHLQQTVHWQQQWQQMNRRSSNSSTLCSSSSSACSSMMSSSQAKQSVTPPLRLQQT